MTKRASHASRKPDALAFEPKRPALVATACFSVWIALLSRPMLSGAFVASMYNDQYSSGYAYRAWAAAWWKKLGHVPLWNPEIFGGMPFVAGMHGDVLYPTAWLRLVLPTHIAMNLGFVVHYVLAGLFLYAFLRRWGVSWTAAVVGGLAYQLSGVIGSYVSPGHDGKLFVTTMLPLALLGLTVGVRDRRLEGYAITALAVGLIMLSPHPQMAQFALLAAGIFTLFLVFSGTGPTVVRDRVIALGLSLFAVIVGVGVSAAQYIPFYGYIPFSPRDATVLNDFAWSAAYAIPWSHLPEFVIPRFTGEQFNDTYWGPNGLKLHSEYLGLIAVAFAIVGAADRERRRMVLWLGGIALLFLLIALGSSTPFFRMWWEIIPFAKSTRAPGMALFIVCWVVATFAAFGVDRVLRGEAPRFATVAMIAGGVVAVLGVSGVFGAMTESLGRNVEQLGLPNRGAIGAAAAEVVRFSAFAAGLALVAAGFVIRVLMHRSLALRWGALALIALVGTDMWLNARVFWLYSRAPEELFATDPIKQRLRATPVPFRVWDVELPSQGAQSVYPGAALMADDIPQLYGHHANEPHAFDVLNGRVGSSLSFSRAGDPRILELFAVNHLIVQAPVAPDSLPGFRRTVSGATASSGAVAVLFERIDPVPYARFVPAAASAPLEQAVATVLRPEFPLDRLVIVDSLPGVPRGTVPNPLPPPSVTRVAVEEWVPGRMRLRLTPPPSDSGWVVVSENWDRPWRGTIGDREARVQRGNGSLITVGVPASTPTIDLRYDTAEYERGRAISLASLGLIGIGGIVPVIRRRRKPPA
jgi:hypothetical protein